jgi:hypothetical protein
MTRMGRSLVAALGRAARVGATGLTFTAGTIPAWADSGTGAPNVREGESLQDGVYQRFQGDLDLGLALGGEIGAPGSRGVAWLSAHYFSMLGTYVCYADALGGGADFDRTLAIGVDLRPAFIPRWAENLEQGPGWFDLTVDSISVALGAFWHQPPDGRFGAQQGLEGSAGLGLPLSSGASGPWLRVRGTLRWPETLGSRHPPTEAAVLVMLGWNVLVTTPLATAANP